MSLHPMRYAPKDGTEIIVKVRGQGERRARYYDCQWLRDPFWRTRWGNDIELEDALGWRPAQ